MSRLITTKELLDDIIRLKDILGKFPSEKEVASLSKYSYSVYLKRFGGLRNCFKIIESNTSESISDEELIEELLIFAKKLGRLPKVKDFELCKIPYKVFEFRFFSLRNIIKIIKEAKIEKKIKYRISDQELIDELKKLREFTGRKLKVIDFKNNKYPFGVYALRFGGIKQILKLINEEPLYLRITDEELLNNLIELKEKLGRIPTQKDFKFSKYSLSHYKKRFGNFHNALDLINCRPTRYKPTDDDLRNEIIRIKQIYNRYPTSKEVRKNSIYSFHQFITRAGTFVKTMYYLGFDDFVPFSTKIIPRKANDFFVSKNISDRTSKDGKLYISAFEASIANQLFDLKNDNKIIDYKSGVQVCRHRRWSCDFLIILKDNKELFLECDGLERHRPQPYDKDNEKIKYYKDNNINYIIIKYKDRNCKLEDIILI